MAEYWAPPSGVLELDGQNEYYRVCFHSEVFGLVWAWLPDDFTMNLLEAWNYILGGGLPAVINLTSQLFAGGKIPNTKYLTAKVWTGSDPLKFSLPLRFVAQRSSSEEIIQPIKQLMKMSLPRNPNGGAWLIPPGPGIGQDIVQGIRGIETRAGTVGSLADRYIGRGWGSGATSGDNITLYIGSYLRIPRIYIESVTATFKGLLNKDGQPMESSCRVNCATLYAPTADDIDSYISVQSTGFAQERRELEGVNQQFL